MFITILGRQPAISLAELESVYGADKIQPLGSSAALVDTESIDLNRLGGTMKLAKQLTVLDSAELQTIEDFLVTATPEHLQYLPEGKLRLGLSLYGFEINAKQLLATGLKAKKVIKAAGRSVRLVPNIQSDLSTAQVIHNQLTGPLGWELVFVRSGGKTVVGQTLAVQDITAYTARDQTRPKRDAKVGMLPPKLAQIIINLAVDEQKVTHVLDPFCGTGVILQEALLMGFKAHGADIEDRMGEFYRENMDWLKQKYPDLPVYAWQLADATRATWEDSEFSDDGRDAWRVPLKFDVIATETYLGRAFSALPSPAVLDEVARDVDTIIKKFLGNVARQTKLGFRMCLAVPAWQTPQGFKHLPTLDHLTDLGYTRLSFVHADNKDLIYHREGQIVGRELVVLIRK